MMPFYRPQYRRAPFQMTRQRFEPPTPNSFRRPNPFFTARNQFDSSPYLNSYEQPPYGRAPLDVNSRPYLNPYEQPPYGRAPLDVNKMMGHVDTLTNGINMMRQLGGIIGLFR